MAFPSILRLPRVQPPQVQILLSGNLTGIPLVFNTSFAYNIMDEDLMEAAFQVSWTENQSRLSFASF